MSDNKRQKWRDEYYKYTRSKPKTYILKRAKNRAKKSGIEFNLTEDDFEIPEYCPILNLKLELPWEKTKPGGRSNSASLDRIDNSKGYVKGNVQIISSLANTMKSSATPEQLQLFAQYFLKETQ